MPTPCTAVCAVRNAAAATHFCAMRTDTEAGNLLHGEKSPYLLQHAANPVHWRAWGPAALAEARGLDRPILLSIGYAACHWCHVMAHESFEDAATAADMNARFVNIKVDREERPDIDAIYMAALHAMGEQGGWPLTMFLTPAAEPYWGGTYFPPAPRWGRPSFRQVLAAAAEAYGRRDPAVARNSAALARALAAEAATTPGTLHPDRLEQVAAAYLRLIDPVHGGLRGAPKFPNPPIFRFLWQLGHRAPVHAMLRAMSAGGIYDHLGGGYARYSTDAEWLVPHFEKMLYDNAQLLELLAFAHADAPDPLYAERAAETVGWLLRDMASEGAFAASEDADSEGEEGRFYVWDAAEIGAVLGDDAPAFAAAYDVTAEGNWEDRTILRRLTPRGSPEAEAHLARARARLFAHRAARPRPGRDDKLLTDWNALAIAALARASAVFGAPAWLDGARTAWQALERHLRGPDGRFAHAWRAGEVTAPGLLEDQAAAARAALALHEATGEPSYLADAIALAVTAARFFGDADGSYFTTPADAADVPLIRPRSAADGATPSGNGIMAEVTARLFHLTGDSAWRQATVRTITAFAGADVIAGQSTLLAAAHLLETAATVVVTGDPGDPVATRLHAAALTAPNPATVVIRALAEAPLPPAHPAAGKLGGPAAYVCRDGTCALAVIEVDALRQALAAAMGSTGQVIPPDRPLL